jgi:hypothetical protein
MMSPRKEMAMGLKLAVLPKEEVCHEKAWRRYGTLKEKVI